MATILESRKLKLREFKRTAWGCTGRSCSRAQRWTQAAWLHSLSRTATHAGSQSNPECLSQSLEETPCLGPISQQDHYSNELGHRHFSKAPQGWEPWWQVSPGTFVKYVDYHVSFPGNSVSADEGWSPAISGLRCPGNSHLKGSLGNTARGQGFRDTSIGL